MHAEPEMAVDPEARQADPDERCDCEPGDAIWHQRHAAECEREGWAFTAGWHRGEAARLAQRGERDA